MSLRLVTVTAAALIASAVLSVPATASAASCSAASAIAPVSDQAAAQRSALLCLINELRAQHHLVRVKENSQLTQVAAVYSRRLVAGGFFAHVDAVTHSTIETRGTPYTSGSIIWALGENLAWATGIKSSPQGVLAMWMASPGHRENLLDPQWREIGLGISAGTPVGAAGATYAAEFGTRVLKPKPHRRTRHSSRRHRR